LPRLCSPHGAAQRSSDSIELRRRQRTRRGRASLLKTLPQRSDLQARCGRTEALQQSLERVAHHFVVACLRQRPSRIACNDVLTSIAVVADRRPQQAQRRTCALQLFTSTVNGRLLALQLFNGAGELSQEDLPTLLHGSIRRCEGLRRAVGHATSIV